MTISEALASDRPDIAVSEWLQGLGEDVQSENIRSAYLLDRFLTEVNSGGYEGLFSWEIENVAPMVKTLGKIGLPEFAENLNQAIQTFFGHEPPITPDEFDSVRDSLTDSQIATLDQLAEEVMNESQRIERATHAFIRAHIFEFEALDGPSTSQAKPGARQAKSWWPWRKSK